MGNRHLFAEVRIAKSSPEMMQNVNQLDTSVQRNMTSAINIPFHLLRVKNTSCHLISIIDLQYKMLLIILNFIN